MLHRIADSFALTPPLTSAIAMADSGQAVFRIEPEPLVAFSTGAAESRLVADESRVVLDQVNPPPAGVPAEKSDIAASSLDECSNIAAHRLAPVFVVTDAKEEWVFSNKIPWVFIYVEIGAVIDREASTLQPADERDIPVPEGLPRR